MGEFVDVFAGFGAFSFLYAYVGGEDEEFGISGGGGDEFVDDHAGGCADGFAVYVYFDAFLYGCSWVWPEGVSALAQRNGEEPLEAFVHEGVGECI